MHQCTFCRWQAHDDVGVRFIVPIFAITLLLTGCAGFGGNTVSSTPTPRIGNAATKVIALSQTIDTISKQVLMNMHLHAWNPKATTHGVITGGLYINWKMDDPSQTNAQALTSHVVDPQGLHDPQVDLLYLTALTEYSQVHPQDTTFANDLKNATKLVIADFQAYSLPKGWIYFYLLKNGQALQNAKLIEEAHTVAMNFYAQWYDPVLGLVYERVHTPGDYDTFQSLQCGAALIDAGTRWNQPDWINAGEKTLNHVISVALNRTYHLFYNRMIARSDGRDQVEGGYVTKPSTQGQAVQALVTAYTLTHNQSYLDIAGQILQSVFGASGLWDQANGGFYFAVDLRSGQVITSYKETRSQSDILLALHQYDAVNSQFGQQEKQLVNLLTDNFYQHTYYGYFYRVTPDFQIYVSKPTQGLGVEDYFTTEAMGCALDGLQATELM